MTIQEWAREAREALELWNNTFKNTLGYQKYEETVFSALNMRYIKSNQLLATYPDSSSEIPNKSDTEVEFKRVPNLDVMSALKPESDTVRDDVLELRKLADHIYDWCDAIDSNGGGWDYWDNYYKDAFWNKDSEIYQLVRKYMTPINARAAELEEEGKG